MGAASASIKAGVCGHTTCVRVEADDDYVATLAIETDCPNVQAYAARLGTLNVLEEIRLRHDSRVLAAARDPSLNVCAGCVVAAGIVKAVRVAAGLALPAVSSIELSPDHGARWPS